LTIRIGFIRKEEVGVDIYAELNNLRRLARWISGIGTSPSAYKDAPNHG
jgi:hypothetical protein